MTGFLFLYRTDTRAVVAVSGHGTNIMIKQSSMAFLKVALRIDTQLPVR